MKRALLASSIFVACHSTEPIKVSPEQLPAASSAPPSAREEPVRVEEIKMETDRAIYAVRGSRSHRRKAVFLAGLCSNPVWYLNAFAWSAVRYGDFVGVQGDVPCLEHQTRWSADVASASRRIEKAIATAGLGEGEEVTVVGYSQGAERAERLAVHDPSRYTRFILISGPVVPNAAHFAKARAVVLMAGTKETQARMREGATGLRAAGIAATFMPLPDANHGVLGPVAQDALGRALDWLEENDTMKKSTGPTVTPEAPRAIPWK